MDVNRRHGDAETCVKKAKHCCGCRDDVPEVMHRPYVETGYRLINQPLWYYVKSVFQLNNEAGNFWTHFLPFLYFAQRYIRMYFMYGNVPYALPFYAHGIGTCYLLLCSSFAHMLSARSKTSCQCAFAIDFAAIYTYGVGMKVPLEFYLCPTQHYWDVSSSVALTIFGVYCACALAASFYASENSWKSAIALSIGLYVVGTAILYGSCMLRQHASCQNLSSLFWQMCDASRRFDVLYRSSSSGYFISDVGFTSVEPMDTYHVSQAVGHNLSLHFFEQLLYLTIGLIFQASNVPERLSPRKFDIFANSHQFFHLATAMAMYAQSVMLELVVIEIKGKYHDGHFLNDEIVSMSLGETIGQFLLSIVLTHFVVYLYWLYLRNAEKTKTC